MRGTPGWAGHTQGMPEIQQPHTLHLRRNQSVCLAYSKLYAGKLEHAQAHSLCGCVISALWFESSQPIHACLKCSGSAGDNQKPRSIQQRKLHLHSNSMHVSILQVALVTNSSLAIQLYRLQESSQHCSKLLRPCHESIWKAGPPTALVVLGNSLDQKSKRAGMKRDASFFNSMSNSHLQFLRPKRWPS